MHTFQTDGKKVKVEVMSKSTVFSTKSEMHHKLDFKVLVKEGEKISRYFFTAFITKEETLIPEIHISSKEGDFHADSNHDDELMTAKELEKFLGIGDATTLKLVRGKLNGMVSTVNEVDELIDEYMESDLDPLDAMERLREIMDRK